jgi:hypothetical protein
MMRFAIGILAIGLSLSSAACASEPPLKSGVASEDPAGEGWDWTHALVDPAEVAGLDQAPNLAFTPTEPIGLGPALIEVSDPGYTVPEERAVAFVYDSSDIGRLWIIERVAPFTAKDLQQEIGLNASDGDVVAPGSGKFSAIQLADGTPAILTTQNPPVDGSVPLTIEWIVGGVDYKLQGRQDSVSQEQAIQIASGLADQVAMGSN